MAAYLLTPSHRLAPARRDVRRHVLRARRPDERHCSCPSPSRLVEVDERAVWVAEEHRAVAPRHVRGSHHPLRHEPVEAYSLGIHVGDLELEDGGPVRGTGRGARVELRRTLLACEREGEGRKTDFRIAGEAGVDRWRNPRQGLVELRESGYVAGDQTDRCEFHDGVASDVWDVMAVAYGLGGQGLTLRVSDRDRGAPPPWRAVPQEVGREHERQVEERRSRV